MKSKEQKRAEAIERAKKSYVFNLWWKRKGWTEEEYLDLFRTKKEIEQRRYSEVI